MQANVYNPVQATTTSLSPPNPAPTALASPQIMKAADWSAYGRLRDIKLTSPDGLPVYAMEDLQGKTFTYVSTASGKSLQDYIGRYVAVYGPTVYRDNGGVRMQYILASHVTRP